LTSFGLVRTGCLHSGDPERRNQLSLVSASLDTRRPPPLSWDAPPVRGSERASLQMQIAPLVRFFFSPLYAAPRLGRSAFGSARRRIISAEKLREIYVRRALSLFLSVSVSVSLGTYTNTRDNGRIADYAQGFATFPRALETVSMMCRSKRNDMHDWFYGIAM